MNAADCKDTLCPRPVKAKGYCYAHYLQITKHGRIIKRDLGPILSRGSYFKEPKNVRSLSAISRPLDFETPPIGIRQDPCT